MAEWDGDARRSLVIPAECSEGRDPFRNGRDLHKGHGMDPGQAFSLPG